AGVAATAVARQARAAVGVDGAPVAGDAGCALRRAHRRQRTAESVLRPERRRDAHRRRRGVAVARAVDAVLHAVAEGADVTAGAVAAAAAATTAAAAATATARRRQRRRNLDADGRPGDHRRRARRLVRPVGTAAEIERVVGAARLGAGHAGAERAAHVLVGAAAAGAGVDGARDGVGNATTVEAAMRAGRATHELGPR